MTISNWHELEDALFRDSWRSDLRRIRSPYAFRGLSNVGYGLQTTLQRLGGDYASLESHLVRNFRKYAHRDVVERQTDWHWQAVAQHHRLPTRLLDWTYSPYVALHFVTSNTNNFDIDGAIWTVDFNRVHGLLPPAYQAVLSEHNANVFTVDMLGDLADSLADLESKERDEFVVFFEPPSIDDRIVNQFALFSFMSDVKASLDDWLRSHPDLWQKIVVPAALKWEIRDRLDQANITERVLFPGLDGLSTWLTRHYSPR